MVWMDQNLIETKIVNVVATANLGQNIDLETIGRLGLAEHDRRKYGGRVAYFKMRQMKGKVSLFGTGKMISVGTTHPEDAAHDLNHVRCILEKQELIKPIAHAHACMFEPGHKYIERLMGYFLERYNYIKPFSVATDGIKLRE